MKIVVIGAGNVATHLSLAIQQTPFRIVQVFSRSAANADALANRLQTRYTSQLHEITTDADLYLFAVKDDALAEVITQVPDNKGLWVHTAGSVPMDVFKGFTARYGVLYPLQTFSRDRAVDVRHVPFFIEAASQEDEQVLRYFAGQLSNNVQLLDYEKRKYVHLAAVFACNFSNHMVALAYQLLESQGISPEALLPLIDETAAKIHSLSPLQAQTGPAVRNDLNVMNMQMELLSNPMMKELYRLISKSIRRTVNSEQ